MPSDRLHEQEPVQLNRQKEGIVMERRQVADRALSALFSAALPIRMPASRLCVCAIAALCVCAGF